MCLDVHSETMKVVVGSSDDIINMVSINKVRVVGTEAAVSTLFFITLETDLPHGKRWYFLHIQLVYSSLNNLFWNCAKDLALNLNQA